MNVLLVFIARISIILYALIAIGVLFSIRGLVRARNAARLAVFGLEREAARQQQRSAVSSLITLVLLAAVVYAIEGFVVPLTVESAGEEAEPTPVVFVTPEPSPTPARLLFPTVTPTVGLPPAEAAQAEATEPGPTPEATEACALEGARITSPQEGRAVSGQVAVEGEANVPNFAQYKFEISGPATGGAWVVVGTYVTPVPAGLLGVWDSTSLPPGNYILRLVIVRSDGSILTPCDVPIVVVSATTGQ